MKDFREIPLTQGKVALVDAEDYEWVMEWGWYAQHDRNMWYARRGTTINEQKWPTTAIIMHRVIVSAPKDTAIDHINGDGLDNRRCNLRFCTNSQNLMNQHKSPNRSSQYKGVSRETKSNNWRSAITPNGKKITLGFFDTEEEAALVYNNAATKYFGEFARLNIIQTPNE